MNRSSQPFDWKTLRFTLKVFAICLVIGFGGQYAMQAFSPFGHQAPHTGFSVSVVNVATPKIEQQAPLVLSSTTPQRVINKLTIADVIPKEGKFIAADLVHMKLSLYLDGLVVAEYPIATKGKPGTPWETPSGFYAVQTKEKEHFSTIGKVYMPYSMQFYGNYFIHGHTYYPDGTPTSSTFSGGCIRLETADAEKVFAFAEMGVKIFVYDSPQKALPPPLSIDTSSKPKVNAAAYLIADVDTGDVYAEQNASQVRPIAAGVKLMTALVANEIISFNKLLSVPEGLLSVPPNPDDVAEKTFMVGDLFYPLLMQQGGGVADALASYYGRKGFVRWMNTTAHALDMSSTAYADSSGESAENISTPEDQFRLAVYLANKKSFVLKITRTQKKTITAEDGTSYGIKNVNAPADAIPFDGGQVVGGGPQDALVSIVSFTAGTIPRRVAVIVLGSNNHTEDAKNFASWIIASAKTLETEAACASCAEAPHYRRIAL